jgi:hypothetical protein
VADGHSERRATWRCVLKMAVARPVSTGVMVAYVASERMKARP